MKSSDKAQGATEYIATYGWAILLVVFIGLALWQLGIFSISVEANTATGFSKIKIIDNSIAYRRKEGNILQRTENNLNFTVTNIAGGHIHGLSMSVGGDCNLTIDCSPWGICSGSGLGKTILAPDETTTVSHICCTPLSNGDPFWVNITFTYWQRVGEIRVNHTERGVLQGFVENQQA